MAKIAAFPMKKDGDCWGKLACAAVTDEGAFTELYDYFFPRVYRYLLGKTKDSALADELVSDTFLRVFKHLKDYDPEKGAFSTWIFRIAFNAMNTRYGSREFTSETAWDEAFDPPAPDSETPEQRALSAERNRELRDAVNQLPERQRKILEMTYWMEMNSGEIAEALGMAPSSVRVTLKHARENLRRILEPVS